MPELYDDKAVYALYDLLNVGTKEAKEILDAVAPLIAAEVLREAAFFWASNPDAVDDETPADCRNWLRDRADEIEAKR